MNSLQSKCKPAPKGNAKSLKNGADCPVRTGDPLITNRGASLFLKDSSGNHAPDGPQLSATFPIAVNQRPRLLDLFCCAGGAATGYHRAGFDVVGIDINPQPNYPFEFIQGDVREIPNYYLASFDAIHASPPCQHYSPLNALSPDKIYPDLVAFTRALLDGSGVPYVIENVMSAPLVKERSIVLCGEMFELRTIRHRRFESRLPLVAPPHPKHSQKTATKQRKARWNEGWHVSVTGDVGTYVGPAAMGIDWMSGNELCEAIPPAYTEFIGRQLLEIIQARREAA